MALNPERYVNVAVQVLPLVEDVYRVVDRSIGAIAQSGLRYEVGPMETGMEGNLDELLEVAKAAQLACFESSAEQVVTLIKIGDQIGVTSIDDRVARYRITG